MCFCAKENIAESKLKKYIDAKYSFVEFSRRILLNKKDKEDASQEATLAGAVVAYVMHRSWEKQKDAYRLTNDCTGKN